MILDQLEIRTIQIIHRARSRVCAIDLAAPTPAPAIDMPIRKRQVRTTAMLLTGARGPLIVTPGLQKHENKDRSASGRWMGINKGEYLRWGRCYKFTHFALHPAGA